MNLQQLFVALILALPVSVISLTITRSSLFDHLRKWMVERNEWLGKLVTCPYCTSHWVSFALVAWYQPRMLQSAWLPVDLMISAFAIVALAMPISFVVLCSFKNMAPLEEDPEKEQLRASLQKARELLSQRVAQEDEAVPLRLYHKQRAQQAD